METNKYATPRVFSVDLFFEAYTHVPPSVFPLLIQGISVARCPRDHPTFFYCFMLYTRASYLRWDARPPLDLHGRVRGLIIIPLTPQMYDD